MGDTDTGQRPARRPAARREPDVPPAEITVEVERVVEVVQESPAAAPPMMLYPSEALVKALTQAMAALQQSQSALAAAAPDPVGTSLTTGQQRLALTYDALRTALGRPGAASIVQYRVISYGAGYSGEFLPGEARDGQAGIEIRHGHVDADDWIVVYGPQDGRPDGVYGEIGRARYAPAGPTWIPRLHAHQPISRLEVHDRDGRPVRLGRPLPRELADES
jgi:hypothetical protein